MAHVGIPVIRATWKNKENLEKMVYPSGAVY